MPTVELEEYADFQDWQRVARFLLCENVPPDEVRWSGGATGNLFGSDDIISPACLSSSGDRPSGILIPRRFINLATLAACHRDAQRFDVLYRLLWRLVQGERQVLQDAVDPLVLRANRLAQEVGRDRHKMQAFVRFRELSLKDIQCADPQAGEDKPLGYNTVYTAWFEPDHYIVRLNASFFCRRFYNMDWTIATPYQSVHWLDRQLYFGAGTDPSQLPDHDDFESYWRCYFASIFNPARLKVNAMQREMPKKYWHNLPEAGLIPQLVDGAGRRERDMLLDAPQDRPKLPGRTRFNREHWLERKEGAPAKLERKR